MEGQLAAYAIAARHALSPPDAGVIGVRDAATHAVDWCDVKA